MILKKDVLVDFNCSSIDEMLSCAWKSPFASDPCATFITKGERSKNVNCDNWKTTSNYQIRYEEKNGLHVCSIYGKMGVDPNFNEEVLDDKQ